MRIQHNIPAMSAYRNYSTNVSALSKNLEKLSSGYKINRAGDDAAGLAISEKMRAQITGLETAQKNAKDGISLVQTAEGALTEVHDMLNRMYELAEQSANGTYADEVDREQLQKEIESLRTEINRIADSSNFNGINLLDGSLQQNNNKTVLGAEIAGKPQIAQGEVAGTFATVGSGTVLHKGATDPAETQFQVDLHNVQLKDAAAGDVLTMKIGEDVTLSLKVVAGTPVNKDEIAVDDTTDVKKIANAFKELFADPAGMNGEIDGQAFTVSLTNGDTAITFKQTNVPKTNAELVDVTAMKVTVSLSAGGAATGDEATGVVVNWTDGTADATGTAGTVPNNAGAGNLTVTESLNTTNIAAVVNELKPALAAGSQTTPVQVEIKKIGGAGDDKDKLGLYVKGVLIGTSDKDYAAITATDTNDVVYTFTGLDEAGTALGTYALKSDGTATTNVAAFDTEIKLKTQFKAGSDDASITMDFSNADLTKLGEAATAAGASDGDIELKAEGTDKVALYVGNKKIAEAAFDTAAAVDFTDAGGNTILTVDMTGLTDINDLGANAFKTGLTFKAGTPTGSDKGTFNVGTTMNVQGDIGGSAQLASTTFTLTADVVKDGQTLTIGQKTYTFAVGKDSKIDTSAAGVIDLTKYEANNADLIKAAGIGLSQKSDDNEEFSIGFDQDTSTVSVHEREGQEVYDKELQSVKEFQKLIHANEAGKIISGKSLMLQIGDTSESFNQLSVDIKDCHADAMGIGSIDISSQTGASEAMTKIKDAINYVSDVRGDLGALQNRLDHTISNLSVMQENIQDAESTIRDVDVAKEMMEYTKNSILVQSAQAMLAQANQLPQGVLQLLG